MKGQITTFLLLKSLYSHIIGGRHNMIGGEIMDFEEFVKKYKPITNDLVEGAPIDGYMFETYGDEIKKVKKCNVYNIWTVIDEEGQLYLINGYHFINRIGYVISVNSWVDGKDIEIKI